MEEKKTLVIGGLLLGSLFLFSFKKKDVESGTNTGSSGSTGNSGLDTNKPKGVTFAYFNKNFGNIRNAGTFRYKWEITPQGNTYKKFSTWEGGAAAMITHFKRYILGNVIKEKGNLNTIYKIIHVWAPTSENDTEGYIKYVENLSGYNRNYVISLKDATAIFKITKAMSRMEGGALSEAQYTEAVFKKAWAMSAKEYPKYA